MNRILRAAIWVVAVVSIAIALYYPVTQYLQGKAIDDEMLKLRQMKADAVSPPIQTDQYAVPDGTNGGFTDPGLEASGAGADKTKMNAGSEDAHGGLSGLPEKPNAASTDRMLETDETARETTDLMPISGETADGLTDGAAEPDKTLTDRKADSHEADANTSGGTVAADETGTDPKAETNEPAASTHDGTIIEDQYAGNATGHMVEADEATAVITGSETASKDEDAGKTDRSTYSIDTITNSMPDQSASDGTNRGSGGSNGSGSVDSDDQAGGGTADSAHTRQRFSGETILEIQSNDAPAPDGTAGAATVGETEPEKPSNTGTARDADRTEGKQTGVGRAESSDPESTDNATMAEESALNGALSPAAGPALVPAQVTETEPVPFVFDESRILREYKALYEENHDLIGWLKIDGTMVDYPVLQRADEEYYLTRDFYGNNNANGQLILDAQCDPFTPDVNLVISGHDMKSGKIFGTLQRYASERFGKQHPIIEFDTLFWRGRYRLVAAFQTWDTLRREDGFRYNVDIHYRLELKNYLEALDQIKLYDTGVPVEFGDQLITLTTCSTQTDDGRFVVVARRLREGEQP